MAEGVAEAGQEGVAGEIPGFHEGVGGLVVVVVGEVFGLGFAPGQIVALEFHALV